MAALVVLSAAADIHAQCAPTVRTVSEPGQFPNRLAGPIATDGSIIGVAKSDGSSTTPAVYFSTYDASLNQITADRVITQFSLRGAAALLYADTASQFGLFYQRTDATLILVRVDAANNLIGGPIIIPHSWSPNDEFDIVWDHAANAYAIAHVVTGGIDLGLWLTMISPTGAVLSDVNVSAFVSSPAQPRVAALPDGTVAVLWTRAGTTPPTLLALLKNGTFVRAVPITAAMITPRTAASGNSILIIYSAPKSDNSGTDLHTMTLDLAGNITQGDTFFLSGSGVDIAAQSLQWNPALSEWVLVYLDALGGLNSSVTPEVRLRRFQSLTATPSDTILSPDATHRFVPAPYPLIFFANGYVASAAREISPAQGGESYLMRLCPFVVTATVDRSPVHPFDLVTFTATPSGGVPGYSYSWQFGDNDSAKGAIVQHRYSAPGTYTVTLTGTDAVGATSIFKTTVVVTEQTRTRAVRH